MAMPPRAEHGGNERDIHGAARSERAWASRRLEERGAAARVAGGREGAVADTC